MIFLRSAEQKLIIKTKDVISDDDVGIFFLNELGPG